MVVLSDVPASNAQIATTLPLGLVAVFVGATNGIGGYSLKDFAQHAPKPHVCFVGRSPDAGDRIAKDRKELSPGGEINFIKADFGLFKSVDKIYREICSKEKNINLLLLREGLHIFLAMAYYARVRSIGNLTPFIRPAKNLRRVVTVLAMGKEGPILKDEFQSGRIPFTNVRGQNVSRTDFMLEHIAQNASEASCVHEQSGL
ncbi:hypothetical protein N7523_000844 [Penicillium sp. IBT 18751x]|nr:hypothetical protein N7523_000844 [Penicillium sp. IBT 18751x]